MNKNDFGLCLETFGWSWTLTVFADFQNPSWGLLTHFPLKPHNFFSQGLIHKHCQCWIATVFWASSLRLEGKIIRLLIWQVSEDISMGIFPARIWTKSLPFLKDWFDTSQSLWMRCCKMKMWLLKVLGFSGTIRGGWKFLGVGWDNHEACLL